MKSKKIAFICVISFFLLIPAIGLTQPAFVNVSSQSVRPGERITATFSPVNHTSAWIGFYKVGSTDTQLISYSYLRNSPDGYAVNAPDEPGEYNFRLFGDGGYAKKIATSRTVLVSTGHTPSGSAFVSVSPARVNPGQSVTANFSSVDNSAAWVGFYEVGSADNRYISYSYLRNSPNGYSVTAPAKSGQYEFRLFGDGGYGKKLAMSNTLFVSDGTQPEPPVTAQGSFYISLSSQSIKSGQAITATFSPIANQAAWIGLYKVGSTDRRYLSYSYLRNSPNGYTVHISEPGQYQFRLFGDGGYEKKVATSLTITVSR